MDKTAINTHLVTTRLKRGFYHLKSVVDQMCGKFLVCLPMKGMISLILLLVRHVFMGDEFLVVFSDIRGIGTEKVQEGHGLGWSAGRVWVRSVRGGSGQDFSNSSGAGFNFANAGRKQTKIFNPGRTLL